MKVVHLFFLKIQGVSPPIIIFLVTSKRQLSAYSPLHVLIIQKILSDPMEVQARNGHWLNS